MPPPREQRNHGDQHLNGDEVKLFIGGLPIETTEMDLRTLLGAYGNIVDIHVMKPSGYSNQVKAAPTAHAHASHMHVRMPHARATCHMPHATCHMRMQPSSCSQRCAFVTFEHHVSALAATKLSGVHKLNPVDRPIVVRFADSQNGKRQRT